MRTFSKDYYSDISLPEDSYAADFAVLDRYLKFSEELLRLALVGIGGIGFWASRFAFGEPGSGWATPAQTLTLDTRWFLAGSLLFLALSALGALGARFYATDSATHFIRGLRLTERQESSKTSENDRKTIEQKLGTEADSLSGDVDNSRKLLVTSTISLALGFVTAAISLSVALFA